MIDLISRYVEDPALLYTIIILLFVIVVGAALFLTPRLAAILDKKKAENKSFYDGMLTEDPNAPKQDEDGAEVTVKEKQE